MKALLIVSMFILFFSCKNSTDCDEEGFRDWKRREQIQDSTDANNQQQFSDIRARE